MEQNLERQLKDIIARSYRNDGGELTVGSKGKLELSASGKVKISGSKIEMS